MPVTLWFGAKEVLYRGSVQCYGKFSPHLWQKQHKTYCSPGLCWTNMLPVPYDSDKLSRVASSPGLLSFQRPGEDRQRLNCTWKQSVKKKTPKKSALLHSFSRFTPFQGLEVERGRANHHRFRRNRKPQKNHSSVRKPLISHCSSERRKRKKKTRCKKKSAVPAFPRPLLIGQSVRKTLISFKMKRNKKKCKYSHWTYVRSLACIVSRLNWWWIKIPQGDDVDLGNGAFNFTYLALKKVTKVRGMLSKSLRSPQILLVQTYKCSIFANCFFLWRWQFCPVNPKLCVQSSWAIVTEVLCFLGSK